MYCSRCGAANNDTSRYCVSCGAELALPFHDDREYNARTVPGGGTSTAPPPYVGGPYPEWDPTRPLPPKRRTNAILVMIGAIVIVAIMIGAVFAIGFGGLGDPGNNSSHSTQLSSGNYTVSYSWVYPYNSGTEWTVKVTIPATVYWNYTDQKKTTNYASYVTPDDLIVDEIAEELKGDAEKTGNNEAQFILSFVQNCTVWNR